MIVLSIGIAFLVLAAWLYQRSHSILSSSVITIGTVTELVPSRGSKGTTYKIKATFKESGAAERTYLSSWSSSSPGYRVNDPIRIYYRREDPSDCGIASFGYSFGAALIIAALGLSLVVVGYAYAHGDAFMEARYPVTATAR